MELIYEKSQPGRRAGRVPSYDLPVPEVPAELRREAPPRLPEVPENEIVRHFTALADRNFGIDTGFRSRRTTERRVRSSSCGSSSRSSPRSQGSRP